MSNYTIFTLENNNDDNIIDKISIDDLFEKKKEHNIREYNLFKKLLNRIHIKIKNTSKNKNINEQFVWFIIPEIIIGYPKYDISSCILFLIDQLKKNNFLVKYYHPNTLFIYWGHYYPTYIRDEIKNKFGIKVDEFGRKINTENTTQLLSSSYETTTDKEIDGNYNNILLQDSHSIQSKKKNNNNKNKYTDIKSYNPKGVLS
jgi:hypothetical protein